MNDLPPMGHNNPPAVDKDNLDKAKKLVSDFTAASEKWLKIAIDEETSGKLADQIAGLKKLKTSVDKERAAQKKPFDEGAREVQAHYKPLIEALNSCLSPLNGKMSEYLQRVQAEKEAEKRVLEEIAYREKQEAEKSAKEAANSGSILAVIEAKEKAEKSAMAEKDASAKVSISVASHSGAGKKMSFRTRKVCEVENPMLAFMTFKDNAKVIEALVSAANSLANSKGHDGLIQGFKVSEIKSVV